MRRAHAAGPLAHADFQKAVGAARRQRVIARHRVPRWHDTYQVARLEAAQAAAEQTRKPRLARPGKAQDGRGPIGLAGVVAPLDERQRGGGGQTGSVIDRQRLAQGLRQCLAPAGELLRRLLVDQLQRQ